MKPDNIPAFVEDMLDAWHHHNLDRFLELLSEDDVVWDDPAMQTPAIGRDAIRHFSETVFRAFPDFHYTIRPSHVCGS